MEPQREVPRSADLLDVLRTRFGHESFRAGQEEVIRSLLEQRDVLAVLPTGAGKSVTYELTSQVLPGLTVVVSPLLALMQDQLRSLSEHGIAAAALNSAQSHSHNAQVLASVTTGQTKLLFVHPSAWRTAGCRRASAGARLTFVVDEADHCPMGSQLRAAYASLGSAIEQTRPANDPGGHRDRRHRGSA